MQISRLFSLRNAFQFCSSLMSIDLSKLNHYDLNFTERMFYGASSLLLLDISNLNTFHDGLNGEEFYDCNKLKYLNIKNYNGIDIFNSIPNNIIICMENFDLLSDSHSLKQKGVINDCSNPCFQSLK